MEAKNVKEISEAISLPKGSIETSGTLPVIPKLTEALFQLKVVNDYFINELWQSLKAQYGEDLFNDFYFDDFCKIETGLRDTVSVIGEIAATMIKEAFYQNEGFIKESNINPDGQKQSAHKHEKI